jgi:peptide chain release factor 2
MEDVKERFNKLLEKINIQEKKVLIRELEAEASKPDFWQDHQTAGQKMKKMTSLQKEVEEIEFLQELVNAGEYEEASKKLDELEMLLFFGGQYDQGGAILSIHSGQGGVEAMDWAQMLFRMYTRYFEKMGWQFETIEETPGEEAGLKSIVVSVDGQYAYGHLKFEAGTHRLVRQSPFNADNLRQTSFALVEVLPQVDQNTDVQIKDDELEWDFF